MVKSKFLSFKSTKLSDYFVVRTNRVLSIDDISEQFSYSETPREDFANILKIDPSREFNRFLVQIIDSTNQFCQLTEVITLNDVDNIYTATKSSITQYGNESTDTFSTVEGFIDDSGIMYLRFDPDNPYDYDYNIKVLDSGFITKSSGINTVSVGFVDLFSFSNIVSAGSSINFISLDKDEYSSSFVGVTLSGQETEYKTYVELHVIHDGENSYIGELYFDDQDGFNNRFLGSFTTYIFDNKLNVSFINNDEETIFIRAKNIGFGNTSVGIGTYRFLSEGQPEGTELTSLYDSSFSNGNGTGPIEVFSMNKNIFTSCKSLVKISIGNTIATHELMTIHDGSNINVNQYPYLSVGISSGIGTFGGSYSGDNLIVSFYPDSFVVDEVEVLAFNEKIYTDIDEINEPLGLEYLPILERVGISKYLGSNLQEINRTEFDLYYEKKPIFVKKFNPQNTSILDKETGIFTIKDHLFNNLEKVLYTPKSTFGLAESPVGIGTTLNSVGVLTDKLPNELYIIKINPDKFRLSTRKEYAEVGIYVTFTSSGQGNSHEIESYEKNSKTLITIDDIIQYPLLYTSLSYTLENNGGSIGDMNTIFSLSGISSIFINEVLRIDDEYMIIENVGFGTTSVGPISFSGEIPLVEVSRGSVGTAATSHTDGSLARIYRGSYNIVGNKIIFTQSPKGSGEKVNNFDSSNLLKEKSSFNGRVFLRSNYDSNIIYDDISEKFTGLDQDYTVTSLGINTVGLSTDGGNGILLINGIFQSPTTENNSNNNFTILEDVSSGVTTVRFTGITSSNGQIIISESDVNQNQLPRGGVIVSLGSTNGVGYAPLVGAAVSLSVSGGSISGITTNVEFGSYGSGYREPVSFSIIDSGGHSGSDANIEVTVGAGGTLSFNIISGGSGYTSPEMIISSPSYENLPVIGVSRLGIGETTETGTGLLLSVTVGASSTSGIGSTTFSVSNFSISRNGYGFRVGDVIKPVGLVTAVGLSEPVEEFHLIVTDVFYDKFGLWNFGSLNYIDSIKNYQDGIRTRFPLYYNSQLLSFEKDPNDLDSQLIDMNSLLLIFINGVIQIPGDAYQFDGGTSFTFAEPPTPEDQISIFFYTGSPNDSTLVNIQESIKVGDQIKLLSSGDGTILNQDPRYIVDLKTTNTIETSIYTGNGINDTTYRASQWIKQKRDLIINNDIVSKSRDSIEPQIYPAAKIIKDFNSTQNEIFVDSIDLFKYDNENPSIDKFDFIIVDERQNYSGAAITSTVSSDGTISSLTIVDSGSGYNDSEGTIDVKFSRPNKIGVGIGTTAFATLSIINGEVSLPYNIINPGFGYSESKPPQVIVKYPEIIVRNAYEASTIEGFAANIIGISTSVGVGTDLSITFEFEPGSYGSLQIGYPIYVSNTTVGSGITSIDLNDGDIVGIGTTCIDNIYYVHQFDSILGIATCNILSKTNTVGINTSAINSDFSVGKVSWGKITGFFVDKSDDPIYLNLKGNITSGLSTYPTIQRRGYGLRSNGSIKKLLS